MALAQVYKLLNQYRVQDKLCSWGIHYECTSGSDVDSDAGDLCLEFGTTIVPLVLDAVATDVTFEGLYASCVVPATALPGRVNGQSMDGVRSGDSAPANLCAVFTLQTGNTAAVRQGRLYFSGISKSDIENGLLKTSYLTGPLQALATALATPLTGSGKTFTPCFLQRVLGGSPITPVVMSLSSIRVTVIPYSQRRRTTKQFGSGGA